MLFHRALCIIWFAQVACVPEEIAEVPETPVDYGEPGSFTSATFDDVTVGSSGVELRLQVWYPSSEEPGEAVVYDGVWPGEATDDLAADCGGPLPVVVFSHGFGGVRWQSAFLAEHLASHGYLVVAPDHTYNTYRDYEADQFIAVVTRRPVDTSDSFDWLVGESENSDGILAGCVDSGAGFAISGHSFGGYTAFASAGAQVHDPLSDSLLDLSDPRVWGVLAMAPWDVDGVITTQTMSSVVPPVMTLSGTRDDTTTWAQVTALHDGLAVEPRYLGEFPDAGHSNFAPVACALFAGDGGCNEDDIDEQTFLSLVEASALTFLESIQGVENAVSQLPEESEDLLWEIVQ